MELDSGADSVSSTPRSINHKPSEEKTSLRLMCSFGGKILPRPHDNQLRYVGGDTRIVAVHRSTTFSSLLTKLSKLLPTSVKDFTIKYQLPNEDLDALITVSTDEDVENMMDEFDRLSLQNSNNVIPRLRLFLFVNNGEEDSRTNSIVSLLDGSRKRESWFLDALNGGNSSRGGLERGRSEVSSIVSEVPDYLFGLDGSDDVLPRFKNRVGLVDTVVGSDPSSPAVVASGCSPFGSASSGPSMPNLPPVKTKMEKPVEEVAEPAVQYTVGYSSGPVWNNNNNLSPAPGSPYRGGHNMQAVPMYYVPSGPVPGPVHRGNPHIQVVPGPVLGPAHGHYIQQYSAPVGQGQVQVPVMYPGSGPVYSGGAVRHVGMVDPYEMQIQGNMVQGSGVPNQAVYYGSKNTGTGMVAPYPGMVMPVKADEASGSGPDANKARSLPA